MNARTIRRVIFNRTLSSSCWLYTGLAYLSMVATMISTLVSTPVQAEQTFIPKIRGFIALKIKNEDPHPTTVWLKKPIKDLSPDNEISYAISNAQEITIPLKGNEGFDWWQLSTENSSHLSLSLYNPATQETTPLSQGRADSVHINNLSLEEWSTVTVYNTSASEQDGLIYMRNRAPQPFHLNAMSSFKWQVGSSYQGPIIVSGAYNLFATVQSMPIQTSISDKIINSLYVLEPNRALRKDQSPSQGKLFLVSNPEKTQSYLINITDDELINQAREQIKNPKSLRARILIAKVQMGHQGYNYNTNSTYKHSWSWNMELIRFAEVASQSCDGYPEFIEEYLVPYIDSEQTTCFWNYKIIQEIAPTAAEAP